MSGSFVPKQCISEHSPYSTDVYITGNLSTGGDITTGNLIVTNAIVNAGDDAVGGDLGVYGDIQVQGNIVPDTPSGTTYWQGNLRVTNDVVVDGFINSSSDHTYVSDDLTVQGNLTVTGTLSGDMIGFRVARIGDWSITDTTASILTNGNVDGTWNSYDTAGIS